MNGDPNRGIEDIVRRNVAAIGSKANLTQQGLADEMLLRGIPWTRETVAQVETTNRKLGFAEAIAVAASLDVPIARLTATGAPTVAVGESLWSAAYLGAAIAGTAGDVFPPESYASLANRAPEPQATTTLAPPTTPAASPVAPPAPPSSYASSGAAPPDQGSELRGGLSDRRAAEANLIGGMGRRSTDPRPQPVAPSGPLPPVEPAPPPGRPYAPPSPPSPPSAEPAPEPVLTAPAAPAPTPAPAPSEGAPTQAPQKAAERIERRMRLRVTASDVDATAQHLWSRSLEAERERRVTDRHALTGGSLKTIRGHVSRDLDREIAHEMERNPDVAAPASEGPWEMSAEEAAWEATRLNIILANKGYNDSDVTRWWNFTRHRELGDQTIAEAWRAGEYGAVSRLIESLPDKRGSTAGYYIDE